MNAKYIEAVLNGKWNHQKVDCIQFGSLYVCADKTSGMGHLVYNQDGWVDELKRCGFNVNETEKVLDIDETTFNELELSHFEFDDCEIYLFHDIAVKVGDSLELFCQANMTIQDAIQNWSIQAAPDELIPIEEYSVPRNKDGDLAVELEKLDFEVWDSFLRRPGEPVDSEERMSSIAANYQMLLDGKSVSDLIQGSLQTLKDMVEEYNECLHSPCKETDQQFYIGQLERCESIMGTVKKLLAEEISVDGLIKPMQATDTSMEKELNCNGEEMEER